MPFVSNALLVMMANHVPLICDRRDFHEQPARLCYNAKVGLTSCRIEVSTSELFSVYCVAIWKACIFNFFQMQGAGWLKSQRSIFPMSENLSQPLIHQTWDRTDTFGDRCWTIALSLLSYLASATEPLRVCHLALMLQYPICSRHIFTNIFGSKTTMCSLQRSAVQNS